jgi:alkanesulfonate monooxygenase SsuD/methylene tetrahydromethanopterin reductase-like flavin-dependent oxidoreductase (luciferase family)
MGERMLGITLPHAQSWNAWYSWFGNTPEGYRPMRAAVDEACRAAGREPAEIERTVALLVAFPDAEPRLTAYGREPEPDPIEGDPRTLAPSLRAFAEEGISHVQLVLEPITVEGIRALAPTLERLDAGE